MKKSLSILSTLLLIGLFVVAAAPLQAASTDERIKALEEELNRLKTEQQEVKKEQQQMQDDALAQRRARPAFSASYRNGRGARFRWGGEKSAEYRIGAKFQTQMSFFPDNDAEALFDDDSDGPSQGSLIFRHTEIAQYFRLMDGLYEFGFTFRGDTSRSSQTKTERMQINFNRWSPYYPAFKINALSPNTYAPLLRVSSSSGVSMERAPIFDGQFSTGSSKGLGLQWDDVPVGSGTANFTLNYLSGNVEWDNKIARDPTDQKGVIVGASIAPFSKGGKGILKGLEAGFTFVSSHDEIQRGGRAQIGVGTRGRNLDADLISAKVNGRREYYNPWVEWAYGPYSLSFAYDRTNAERRENTEEGIPARTPDLEMETLAFAAGVYVWGPDGFLSGSRNGGWRFTYSHVRNHFDQGEDSSGAPATLGEDFDMEDWYYIENIFMLRWYQKSNVTYALEYQINHLNQMRGGGDAADTRERLGILANGGTYQIITLNALFQF